MNTIEVHVNGKAIRQYKHEGKTFVEARKGNKYEVKLKNNTSGRVLAVASIDGIDVLSGKEADSNSGGYVLAPHSSYYLKGFRTSNDSVNLFQFSDKKDSYAVKSPTGAKSDGNCGIISVRFVAEKQKKYAYKKPFPDSYNYELAYPFKEPFHKPYKLYKCSSESIATAACCSFDTGTKFSEEKVRDEVITTSFERGNLLEEVNIYYASRKSLEKLGICFDATPKVAFPQGFKNDFCQPPN